MTPMASILLGLAGVRLEQDDGGVRLDQRPLDGRDWFPSGSPRSSAGSALASLDLKTARAASRRRAGSGDSSVRLPSAASMARRTRLLTRTGLRSPGADAAGFPVAASRTAPARSRMIDPLLLGAEQQPAVLQGFDHRDRERTAALGDGGDRRIGVGEVVGGEARRARSRGPAPARRTCRAAATHSMSDER